MVIEVYYTGLEISPNLPPIIAMEMVFIMMEVLECLIVKKDVDLGINRPATLPLEIVEFIIVLIEVMMTEDMDIGLNRSAIIILAIMGQLSCSLRIY